uniref:Uncharacterized protein n=1 Tax=Romanomermis culicivorax TaxID=13658 RepID=A0A915K9S5_ROMCU
MESTFGEHMIKSIILSNDSNDQCVIGTNFWHFPTFTTALDNNLEEIPKEERVSFCDNKSDTFSQIEEIKAKQSVRQPQPSLHQPPSRGMEVTELAELTFLIAQVSISISPNCQQWVTGAIFPSTSTSVPDLIVQGLPNNQVATEFPIETAIVNITNGRCPL